MNAVPRDKYFAVLRQRFFAPILFVAANEDHALPFAESASRRINDAIRRACRRAISERDEK
jgi:hypothetical protein